MAASTNRVLYAVVVLHFALVLKLITSHIDLVVFVIALAGLVIGWWGVTLKEQQ